MGEKGCALWIECSVSVRLCVTVDATTPVKLLQSMLVRIVGVVIAGETLKVSLIGWPDRLPFLVQSLNIVEKAARRAHKRARGQKVPA